MSQQLESQVSDFKQEVISVIYNHVLNNEQIEKPEGILDLINEFVLSKPQKALDIYNQIMQPVDIKILNPFQMSYYLEDRKVMSDEFIEPEEMKSPEFMYVVDDISGKYLLFIYKGQPVYCYPNIFKSGLSLP